MLFKITFSDGSWVKANLPENYSIDAVLDQFGMFSSIEPEGVTNMNLSYMVRAAYARMSDVEIDVDTAFGTVAIGEYAFMQGDGADAFINEAREIWEKCGDVTLDEVYAYLAEPYAIE